VDGNSMNPTYKSHNVIVHSKFYSHVNKMLLQKNTIIKFTSPENYTAIKRIIAVPGDVVETVSDGSHLLKINGKLISSDPTIIVKNTKQEDGLFKASKYYKKYKLGVNEYFVSGDNSNNSEDSRAYGPIKDTNILSIVKK
jgi:signal peptidase I